MLIVADAIVMASAALRSYGPNGARCAPHRHVSPFTHTNRIQAVFVEPQRIGAGPAERYFARDWREDLACSDHVLIQVQITFWLR